MRVIATLGEGHVVAGDGFAYYFDGQTWTNLGLDDFFHAAASLGDTAILSGQRGIFRVTPRGAEKLRSVNNRFMTSAVSVDGKIFVFSGEAGVFVWDGKSLEPVDTSFPWSGGDVGSVQALDSGELIAANSQGLFSLKGRQHVQLLQRVWTSCLKNLVIHATRWDDLVIVTTFRDGITAYSQADESVVWNVPLQELGGNVYSATQVEAGLIVGSSGGLYFLPNPTQNLFHSIPSGDFRFAARINGESVVGLTTGVWRFRDGVQVFDDKVFSAVELSPGNIATGGFGLIRFNEKVVGIGGRDVGVLVRLDNSTVAALQPQGLAIVRKTGETVHCVVPASPNTLAPTSSGNAVVGTSSGAFVFDPTGKQIASFGTGLTRAFATKNGAILFDSANQLYSETGKLMTRVPFRETIDAISDGDKLYVLARVEGSDVWAGTIDPRSGAWQPFDLPLPQRPTQLLAGDEGLTVFAPKLVLEAKSLPKLQTPVMSGVVLYSGGVRLPSGKAELSTDKDTIDIQIPAARLSPWRNPSYTVQIGDESVEKAAPGSRVRIPRLRWGKTDIQVRAEWAGLASTANFEVYRQYPLWLRAPAFILYIVLAALAGYAALRWRTAHLLARARELQGMVDDRTAELRKAQKAREDFFSTLSHEIRNPLNGVVGICEILEEASSSAIAPRERVFVRNLRACADQLRSILDDVLDFARIDRGTIQIHEEPFELLGAIEGAARAADAELSRCTLHLPPEPLWLSGDSGKIRQIVTNLISNALKYGVPPEARVEVLVGERTPGEKTVRISVVNTGPTIPPDELEAIFSGFVRGSDAVKRNIRGTGIGLAVSRRMAQALGGSLIATSHEGLTEFRLELHCAVATPPVESDSSAAVQKTSRALAIEDEQYNRLVLGHILSRMGYEVDWAPDGATAMERVRACSYDLILTDFMLPDTTGVELARKMLEELKEPKPPIVAVTAYSTPDKIQQARDAGIVGFVTKPISKKKLESAIRGVAPKVRMRQALEPDAAEQCDFSSLLRLPNGRQILLQYADELPNAWNAIAGPLSAPNWQQNAAGLARTVHAFRSRMLAVHATDAATQLALLEEAVHNQQADSVQRLISVIGPSMLDISEAARQRALAPAATSV